VGIAHIILVHRAIGVKVQGALELERTAREDNG
jgi:hypothetical protein